MSLSISSYINQIVAGQSRKPSPIHDALQAIQSWASAGLVDADIAGAAGIAISKTALGTYTPPTAWTPTLVGWSGSPLQYAYYSVIGKMLHLWLFANGTSNSTTTSFTLPTGVSGLPGTLYVPFGRCADNGSLVAGYSMAELFTGGSVVTLYKDGSGTTWTASGTKYVYGHIVIPLA